MKFLEKSKKITVLLLAMVMVLSNVVPAMAQTVSSSKKTKGEELKTTRVVEDGRSYTCIPLTKEQVKSMEKPIYSLRSVGEDIPDGRYSQIAFEWGVYDSYFPANTKVELFVADIQNKKKIVIGETDVLDKSDFVDEHGKGYNVKKYYMLKQTANYDEWDAKAKADSKNYKYGLRYPENLLYSVTARFTKGVEMTVNQVAMSLYSVDWNTLGNEKLNLKANFYETADEAFPVELNECDNGKKYYTTMQDHDKITYVIKDDGSSEQVEIHGGSKNWIRTSAGLDNELGASRNRFELIDPKTGKEFPTPGYQGSLSNDYGLKEGEFTVPDTGKHYKFKVTGDHRTPFNIAVTQQLNVILNLNDGTMDGAQNGKKTVKVWYGEDSTEPTAPKKQNVMFLGWSDQEGATEVADGGFLPKKFTEDNKNYYAVYSVAPKAVSALSLKLNATADAAKAKEAIANNANMPGKTRDQQVKLTTYAWEKVPVTTNPDKNGTNYNVILTYPDGTTATVPVLVKVTDDRTDADKYGANLAGKDIRVWKDTPTKNINWRDGVVDPTDEATEKAFKKATVSEGTDPARKTDIVGTVAGKVKVTWEDTSTTLVDQNLIVLNNVVDEGTELPKEGGIKVTFKKGTGVATIENGTADITKIVGPSGYELKTADFPPAQVDVNYDPKKVIWEDKMGGTLYVVDEDNNEFTAVAEKLSEETVIPYTPSDNGNPTDENDKNIPKTDSTGKNIDPTQYVRVAVKIDPVDAGVLAIKDKVGSVVSALVKKGTKWETVKAAVDTNKANAGYAFWYWEDSATGEVQENEVKTAYFIKDGQEIEEKDKGRTLPTGWHKVTVIKDDATIEGNALYGKTYAVAPKDEAKGTTGMLAQDKFPTITVKTVANKELSEGAWYDVADVEKEVKDPWTIEVEKDTTFKAKAEEMVTINYARNPEKAEDGTDIARLTRDDEKVKLSGEPKGSKVELKNNDYKFVNWTNEANQEVSKALEYKPSSNVKQTYTANFVKKADVMITYKVNDEEAGTVNDKLKDTESLAPSTGNAKGATAKAKPGYEFVNWTNEAGKQVSVAEKFVPEKKNGLNVEATYTANFKQLISAQPSIQPVTEGDKDITVIVEGNPKGTLEVTIPGVKNPIPATKQKDGSYKVTVPEEITLKSGDEIVATFTEENKKPSTDRVTVKGKTSTPITPPKSDKTVERVDGDDRVDTSIEVSKKYFRQAETVIVARKDLYPDALSAAVLSRLLKAPILLTATNELDERVAQEIKRLGASQVIIAGGYSAISKYTERELSQFDKDKVERLGGLDRYETSAIVAERVLGITGGSSHRAVVATGEDFPDALTSGAFAAKEAYPILLVRSSGVPETINKVIRDNKINEVYVIGGETRIPSKVVSQLPKMIARLAGSDRYETSVAVAKYAFGNSYKAYIASGEVFPDTLVIAPVAARDFAPILLTTKNELPESVKSYIDSSNFSHFVIVGGPARISKAIEESLAK